MPLKTNIFQPWTLLCMDTAHIIVYLHMKISPSSVSWLNRVRLQYSNVDCTGQLWLTQESKHKGDKWKLPKVIKFHLWKSPTSHFIMSFTHPRKRAVKQVVSSLVFCLFLYKRLKIHWPVKMTKDYRSQGGGETTGLKSQANAICSTVVTLS